jgi:hypothetical protein
MSLAKAIVGFGLWGLIALFACPATHAFAADDAWALLKKPGQVVLLRHSNAPGSQTNPTTRISRTARSSAISTPTARRRRRGSATHFASTASPSCN